MKTSILTLKQSGSLTLIQRAHKHENFKEYLESISKDIHGDYFDYLDALEYDIDSELESVGFILSGIPELNNDYSKIKFDVRQKHGYPHERKHNKAVVEMTLEEFIQLKTPLEIAEKLMMEVNEQYRDSEEYIHRRWS